MIVPTLARLLIREHLYKPIQGTLLTLGRQTIAMTHEQFIELLQQEKFPLSKTTLEDIAIGQDQKTRVGKGTGVISDTTFFNLLGIKKIHVMDVSSYENADIIHDLNNPVPESLKEQFNFIIDGGTFDHLVDIRIAFENIVKMLKPGGRVFHWNAASNFTGAAYLSFGPDLFYDYYVLNHFVDCKVYVAEIDTFGQSELWDFYEFNGYDQYGWFRSKRILMVVAISEKGPFSTWENMPVQAQYRDAHLWQMYRESQKRISLANRKSLIGSRFGQRLDKTMYVVPRGLINRIALKLREKGVVWVCKKVIRRIFTLIKQKTKMFNANEIKGFRYVGKI